MANPSFDQLLSMLYASDWTMLGRVWVVPAGLVFLYFYGVYHFNTPVYTMEVSSAEGVRARLITQAPPKITTTRLRYSAYAHLYAFGLQAGFVILVFFYPLVRFAASRLQIDIPDLSGTLDQRVVLALLLLTGVLSSFPVVNRIDTWILNALHKRAYIPDESRYLARKLYEADFVPDPNVFSEVRDSLAMRDTHRVAQRQAKGALETRIIELLCLKANVHSSIDTNRYRRLRVLLEEDFDAITKQSQGLREDVKSYLRWQARVVPDNVLDIDAYIESHQDNDDIVELGRRRTELKGRCDAVFETMCLVTSLAVCSTNLRQFDAEDAVRALGFRTIISPLPMFDLETVLTVTGSSFLIWILFSRLYKLIGVWTGLHHNFPEMFPSQSQVLKFSILLTTAYAVVITLAIKFKRWRRADSRVIQRSENATLALISYGVTVWFNMGISYVFNHNVTSPLPYMFAVNQAVLGYFLGKYIDGLLKRPGVDWRGVLLQATIQAAVAGFAASFVDRPGIVTIGFSIVQWFVTGLLVGTLFQYVYGQAVAQERAGSPGTASEPQAFTLRDRTA